MRVTTAIVRRSRRHGDERGVAALELSLFLVVLFGLFVLLAPLGNALLTKVRVERATGAAARFATQIDGHRRPGATTRRPTVQDICNDALLEFRNAGGSATSVTCNDEAPDPSGATRNVMVCTVSTSPSRGTASSRRAGDEVTVRCDTAEDLSVFGGFLNAVGIASRSIGLSATSVARQE
jgi:Flp pilus assembly protein TadG